VKVRDILGRSDYALISELIPQGARVLDLGCGDGALLAWLKENKQVEARGVELRRELVQQAIARGVTVHQGDIAQSLPDYPDLAFDYVILSRTLQEVRRPLDVLNEMLRIGRHAVVTFPNFGHWRARRCSRMNGTSRPTSISSPCATSRSSSSNSTCTWKSGSSSPATRVCRHAPTCWRRSLSTWCAGSAGQASTQ
jgi:SAM-dependent methyltransferase